MDEAVAGSPAPLRAVRSFDVWDTLLARRVPQPDSVFEIVERRTGWTDFRATRMKCYAPTLRAVYETFQMITRCSDAERAALVAAELLAEADAVYLIRANAALVRPGDLLVSDMYLSPEDILTLLRRAGFDTPVELVVTYDGKAGGWVWPQLRARFSIEWHLGDNPHSDVRAPAAHGVEGRLTTLHAPTIMEQCFAAQGSPWAAQALREFRLTAAPVAAEDAELFALQTEQHVPLLLHMCAAIAELCAAEGRDTVLLCTRDGCLLERVLPALYPHLTAVRFHTSRVALRSGDAVYARYVRALFAAHGGADKCLVFDVVGGTMTTLRFLRQLLCDADRGVQPRMLVYAGGQDTGTWPPGLSCTHSRDLMRLEFFNADVVGMLLRMEERADGSFVDVRVPAPIASRVLAPHWRAAAHALAAFAARPAPSWWTGCASMRDALRPPHLPPVRHALWEAAAAHVAGGAIANARFANAFSVDDFTAASLTALANECASDRGTLHGCAHGYARAYEDVLPRGAPPHHGVALLELGAAPPSLRVWARYYGGALRLVVGAGSAPDLASFHYPAKGAHVVACDLAADTAAACARAAAVAGPLGYDMIVDDGVHDSHNQHAALRCLWPALAPGGVYAIETAPHSPSVGEPSSSAGPSTKALLRAWARGELAASPHLPLVDAAAIMDEVAEIRFFDSQSPAWTHDDRTDALIVLRKRMLPR